jgi:exopolysaccharide biosynthesis polyprenyl glycosylphosphotransferase
MLFDASLPKSQHDAEAISVRTGETTRSRRVLIIGAGAMGQSLARSLAKDPQYQVVGFLDDETFILDEELPPLLGPRDDALRLVKELQVDQILLAHTPSWQQNLMNDIVHQGLDVQVNIVPTYYEAMIPAQLYSIGDVAVLPVALHRPRRGGAKRAFDFVVSLVMLILLFPAAILTALIVAVSSPGPVLFVQERVGYKGKTFSLLKFRTMRTDAESATGPVLSAGKNDSRLTPIGRWLRLFRLDEIPQLINVLRGEMSLVGPRPERPHFVEQFVARNPVYQRRHDVPPGITGLAQIHGGYHTDARDKLRFDLYYVAHHSVRMDISLLAQTILKILVRPDGC